LATIVLISGCSLLGTKQIEVVSKPVELQIIQPTLPREVSLNTPKWYVVSEARIANPCKKVDDKRPKSCELTERENPDWPVGYTYLDRFLDDMKAQNNGDVVFVATTIGDYKQMTVNNQEIRRYIRELGEVVVYYRNVTLPSGEKGVAVEVETN
tara:strand:+ start:2849 stop:3310 length:462 start_codon:yes stop_codon:yes gene_type:complete